MSISAITSALPSVSSLQGALPSLPDTSAVADTAGAAGFGDLVTGALENLNSLHTTADNLAVQAATGDLTDVHEYTIAATEAELATQLTVAVRDKAVEAFNDIMRMQV